MVTPGRAGSALLADVPDPRPPSEALLVQAIAIGICGTDAEIVSGHYGSPPPGRDRLVIGHESIGRVLAAPRESGFLPGDLVTGIVRRPDPVPCASCAVGEWDMCRNGRYRERGIKALDGYGAERFVLEPSFAVKVDAGLGPLGVLIEPASVVAKAWDQAERIARRSASSSLRTVLVTGAGPIGLLAALMGRQRGLDVHVFDRIVDGPKPDLVEDLGCTYYGGSPASMKDLAPDLIIECTGAGTVVADAITRSAPSGIVCLAGLSSGEHVVPLDVGGVNRRMVLENDVVFGSVNANRSHYEAAAAALAQADRRWLSRLITRRVAIDDWEQALVRGNSDIKVVLQFEDDA